MWVLLVLKTSAKNQTFFNVACYFFKFDFVKSSKGVGQQHTKVIIQKTFMSIQSMAAECVNSSMMPVAVLQWTVTKPPNIFLRLFFF